MSSRASRIRSVARHPIAQNALALYAVQGVVAILPLVTVPWLARALGPAELGVVLFTQSFSFLVGTLVEYGFGLSATREIGRARDEPEALARIVSDVLGAKLALMGAAAALSVVALAAIPQFRADPVLVLYALAMAVLQGLSPAWFFSGIERLRMLALVEVTVRVLTAVAIVLLVREEGQGLRVLAIWTAGGLLGAVFLTIMLYRNVAYRSPTVGGSRTALRAGGLLFISGVAAQLYTTGTVVMLGLIVSSAQLALFSSAERLVRATMRVIGPVGGATYARTTYLLSVGQEDRSQRLSTLALLFVLSLALVAAVLLFVLAPDIVRIVLGPEFAAATPILRTLALLLPLVAIAGSLAGQWLLPRGFDKAATRITVGAGIANLAIAPIAASVGGIQGGAWGLVVIETGVTAGMLWVMHRHGLIPTRRQALGRTG